jgi:L-alanine-DL-glutamate epimerase-like enolase superfamily enzyme
VGPLKITKIEAVGFNHDLRIQGIAPNWTWVRLHTDEGITGIGESYSEAGHLPHVAVLRAFAHRILGRDAADIDRLWQDLFYQISYAPWGGAETRMLSALNVDAVVETIAKL